MNVDQKLARVGQIERHVATLQAEQARLIAAIVEDPCKGMPAPVLDKQYLREELRIMLGESAAASNARIHTAQTLVHHLPHTLAALEAGQLTMRHADAVCNAVSGLSQQDKTAVEIACVPFATGRDYTAFSRKLRREVLARDSTAVQQRQAAAVADRHVWCRPNLDGATAGLGAILPADDAQTVLAAVNAAADQHTSDDSRTREQRRADGLVQVARDWLNGVGMTRTGQRPYGRCSKCGGAGPNVQVTVAASTLLGLDQQPADLAGHGLIPAAMARRIAADPTGTWRRLITDEQGHLLDYGRTRYRPPAPLARFVMARDRECQFPGCHRHASGCEIDHRVAWEDGGPTNAANLHCLCPRHHHLKHEAGWTVEQLPDGTTRWTSPTRQVRDTQPPTYPTTTTAQAGIVVSDDNDETGPPHTAPWVA